MHLRIAATCLLLSLTALAGCADAEPADGPTDITFDDDLQATDTTGLILGVVVDATITPLAEATVTVTGSDLRQSSDAEGRFAFEGLAAGIYFLEVAKPGYDKVKQSVEVVAGVDRPDVVRVLLEARPGSAPAAVPIVIDGLMVCSAQVAIAFATGCMVGAYTGDQSRNQFPIDGLPDHFQSELMWESTQSLGTDLCMRNYASNDIGGDIVTGDDCGPSPIIGMADNATLAGAEVGTTYGIENVVWVSPLYAGPAPVLGLALDQYYTVYNHAFYNMVPEEGWTFIADGAPL